MRPIHALAVLLALAALAIAPRSHADEHLYDPSFGLGVGVEGRQVISFDAGGTNADVAKRILRRADGKLILVGEVATATGKRLGLTRLNPNGTIDTSFGTNGRIVHDACFDEVNDAVLDAQERIIVVGQTVACAVFSAVAGRVARYLPNGQLDAANFGVDGYTRVLFPVGNNATRIIRLFSVVVLTDGNYIVGGSIQTDPANAGSEGAWLGLVTSQGGAANTMEVDPGSPFPRRVVAGVALPNTGSAWVVDVDGGGGSLGLGGLWKLSSTFAVDSSFGGSGWQDFIGLTGSPSCDFPFNDYETTSMVIHGNTVKAFGWVFANGVFRGWWASMRLADGSERNFGCHPGMSGMQLNAASADPGTAPGRIVVAGACNSLAPSFCLHALRPVAGNPDQLESDPAFNGGARLTLSFPSAFGVEPGGLASDVLRIGGGKTLVAGWRLWNGFDTDYAIARLGAGTLLADGFEASP